MALILSCISKGEDQTRRILDRLGRAGTSKQAMLVLHSGDVIEHGSDGTALHALGGHPDDLELEKAPSAITTVASGGTVGGTVGWLIGFGILALPGAILGGAIGAVAGVAVGATRHAIGLDLPMALHPHYGERIVGDQVAILVKVDDAAAYELTLQAFLGEHAAHIMTSENDRSVAISEQIAQLPHIHMPQAHQAT